MQSEAQSMLIRALDVSFIRSRHLGSVNDQRVALGAWHLRRVDSWFRGGPRFFLARKTPHAPLFGFWLWRRSAFQQEASVT